MRERQVEREGGRGREERIQREIETETDNDGESVCDCDSFGQLKNIQATSVWGLKLQVYGSLSCARVAVSVN